MEIGKQQEVKIDRAMLEKVGGGRVPVTYEIRDRVNNRSRWAPYKHTDVEIEVPNAPEAPSVIMNGKPVTEIDLAILGADDAIVWVPRYDGILSGQNVKLEWRGLTAANERIDHEKEMEVPDPVPIFLEFKVPNSKVILLGQGSAQARYVVDERRPSKMTPSLPVRGEPVRLAKPEVPEAPTGELDPAAVPDGARFIVPVSRAIENNARITIYWNGTTSDEESVPHTDSQEVLDNTRPLLFLIPADRIRLIAGGKVKAYYIVSNAESTLPPSVELSLLVRAASTQPLPIASVDGVQGGKLDADRPQPSCASTTPAWSCWILSTGNGTPRCPPAAPSGSVRLASRQRR